MRLSLASLESLGLPSPVLLDGLASKTVVCPSPSEAPSPQWNESRVLLNLALIGLLNPASLRYSRTSLGGEENHSVGGVLVHLGSLSASMSRLCLPFLGLGDRNE